jgi:hypothetical protein
MTLDPDPLRAADTDRDERVPEPPSTKPRTDWRPSRPWGCAAALAALAALLTVALVVLGMVRG